MEWKTTVCFFSWFFFAWLVYLNDKLTGIKTRQSLDVTVQTDTQRCDDRPEVLCHGKSPIFRAGILLDAARGSVLGAFALSTDSLK